jgi:nucleotide-binding universal stress UspA family protein
MKNIIVPVDFSELSLKGIDLALILAKKYSADIQIVHVLEGTSVEFKSEVDHLNKDTHNRMDELVERYAGKAKGFKVLSIIKEGKIHKEVVGQADAFDDSVIVTTTHGGSGFEELFIGSNAYKIISSTNRPVFTLRGDKVPEKIGKIVLPIDSTNETREKVPFTAKLASLFGAEIHVVTVTSTRTDNINKRIESYAHQVENYLKAMKLKCVRDSLFGDNLTDITIEYADRVKADLISIMSEQEKSLSNLLLGNYAHQMINKSLIPVLVISNRHIGIITESFKTEGIYYE